jgi:hypothetical protein
MKTEYMVGRRVLDERGNASNGWNPVFHFEPDLAHGRHARNIDAKRAYLKSKHLDPQKADVASWSDKFVRTHFDTEARNEKTVKIIKVPTEAK